MSVLTESCINKIDDNDVYTKSCVERKILIELIKFYGKTFNQEKLRFEDVFINAIESKLRETLGDAVVTVIKNYLEKKFSLRLRDAIEKPEEFFIALEKIFGKNIRTLERLILNEIQEKIKI
ncbi:DUF3227 domain-containing protein [Candidatus Bathyarchaeota archaeon]|nr:DUF3227 domain-containing protein [Candidatus Bathyarchaeota archaeon]